MAQTEMAALRKQPSVKEYLIWKEYFNMVGFFTEDKLGPIDSYA